MYDTHEKEDTNGACCDDETAAVARKVFDYLSSIPLFGIWTLHYTHSLTYATTRII